MRVSFAWVVLVSTRARSMSTRFPRLTARRMVDLKFLTDPGRLAVSHCAPRRAGILPLCASASGLALPVALFINVSVMQSLISRRDPS